MNKQEREQLAIYLTDALGYWKADVSEFTLSVWISACDGYTLEQVKKAIVAHATDPERGQFAPKVADIVRQLVGTISDRSALAWAQAYEAMSRVGAYSDVTFADKAINAAIRDCGGWVKCCRTDEKELSYLQHRFCMAYKAYQNRGDYESPIFLNGDSGQDADYTKRGLTPPKPVVIGETLGRIGYAGQGAD